MGRLWAQVTPPGRHAHTHTHTRCCFPGAITPSRASRGQGPAGGVAGQTPCPDQGSDPATAQGLTSGRSSSCGPSPDSRLKTAWSWRSFHVRRKRGVLSGVAWTPQPLGSRSSGLVAALPYPALPPSAQKQAVSAAATLRPALPPLTVLVPVSAVAMCVQACAYVYMRVHACVCVCAGLLRLLHSMLSQDLRVLDTQHFPVFRLSDLSKSPCQPPAFGSRRGDPLPLWGSGAGAGEAWRVDPASWRLAG